MLLIQWAIGIPLFIHGLYLLVYVAVSWSAVCSVMRCIGGLYGGFDDFFLGWDSVCFSKDDVGG